MANQTFDNYVFFWKTADYQSQWHPRGFTDEKREYKNTEQYMMYHKALCAGDEESATKILTETNPRKIKEMGRKVKNLDAEEWNRIKYDVVVQGNLLKFQQCEDLRKLLLATGDKLLIEASFNDAQWGIGLDESSARKMDPAAWPGKNLLGKALMDVREKLKLM